MQRYPLSLFGERKKKQTNSLNTQAKVNTEMGFKQVYTLTPIALSSNLYIFTLLFASFPA